MCIRDSFSSPGFSPYCRFNSLTKDDKRRIRHRRRYRKVRVYLVDFRDQATQLNFMFSFRCQCPPPIYRVSRPFFSRTFFPTRQIAEKNIAASVRVQKRQHKQATFSGTVLAGEQRSPRMERATRTSGADASLDSCPGGKLDFLPPEEGSCLLYTSPSPRDATLSRMPSSA